MELPNTENPHNQAIGLDERQPSEILSILLNGQLAALNCVNDAQAAIEWAAHFASRSLAAEGKLVYVGAGSSGLMAMADALELPGTYGFSSQQISFLIAGGTNSLINLDGSPEDDAALAQKDIQGAGIEKCDCIIAVSASGRTPYVLSAVSAAQDRNATIIGIANTVNSPLLKIADVGVLLETPPEVIAGSTRMGAATAQKAALNMISTLTAIILGLVHDGHMVNMNVDNKKLEMRAIRIVSSIGSCSHEASSDLLNKANGSIKIAILLALGATSVAEATKLLNQSDQKLRPALASLKPPAAVSMM